MPFLTLNGITVPVSKDGGDAEWRDEADMGRSASGTFIGTIGTSKRSWKIELRRLAKREAAAWERLAKGLGHRFSFADEFSSKGLAAVTTGTVTFDGASGKFGKRVTVASGATAAWTLGTDRHHGLVADYTVSVWHEDSGPVWAHYLFVRHSGVVTWYLDGVLQGGSAPAWLDVDLGTGTVTLGEVGTEHAFSEMVVHPFAIGTTTGEWVTSFSGATSAHPDLPTLRAAGDLVAENGETSIEVECPPGRSSAKPAPFTTGGAWDVAAKEVSFELEEV